MTASLHAVVKTDAVFVIRPPVTARAGRQRRASKKTLALKSASSKRRARLAQRGP